jgi:SHS2 domain-containing protein
MYTLSGAHLQPSPRQQRSFSISAPDPESLLVRFLSELLYFGEAEGLAFDGFDLRMNGDRLNAYLEGAPIASLGKEIKAVTYHNLKIQKNEQGLRVRIVFDV